MKSKLYFWSMVSALAGFLFGFDTVVISGAEKTIQSLWGLSNGMHGLAMSARYGGRCWVRPSGSRQPIVMVVVRR